MNRRKFLAIGSGSLVAAAAWRARADTSAVRSTESGSSATKRIAVVQFDAVPEQIEANLQQLARLTKAAAEAGARWIMFHEATLCDYTPRVKELAEAVPDGRSTRFVCKLAKDLGVFVSFGLLERDNDRFHITQVFVGPAGFISRYRKTWLWYSPDERAGDWRGGHRDEWECFDPGTGPESFNFDGVTASCFICADGNSQRCLDRVRQLRPQVVFYPNNRSSLGDPSEYALRATKVDAPLLVANRVGKSWVRTCNGGSLVYDRTGKVLARANRDGREEVLVCDLTV